MRRLLSALPLTLSALLLPLLGCLPAVAQFGTALAGPVYVASSGGGGTAPTFVQAQQCNSGNNSCTITISGTTGNIRIVGVVGSYGAGDTVSVTGTINTYTAWSVGGIGANDTLMEFYIVKPLISGSETVTCYASDDTYQMGCVLMDFTPGTTTGTLDQNATHTPASTATAWTTGATGTTTAADEIVLACGGYSNADNTLSSAGSGWTVPTNGYLTTGNDVFEACEYQLPTSTSTFAMSINVGTSEIYGGILGTWK
jgi:hypothetical protein